MLEAMGFWFAKILTEFLVGLAIFVVFFIVAMAYLMYDDLRERRIWRSKTKEWRLKQFNQLPINRIKPWMYKWYNKDKS